MSNSDKKITLRRLFWDYEVSEEEFQDILKGKISRAGHLDKETLYVRILTSLDWYSILDLVGTQHLQELLSESVLSRIYSKDLRRKYAVAKRVLFQ